MALFFANPLYNFTVICYIIYSAIINNISYRHSTYAINEYNRPSTSTSDHHSKCVHRWPTNVAGCTAYCQCLKKETIRRHFDSWTFNGDDTQLLILEKKVMSIDALIDILTGSFYSNEAITIVTKSNKTLRDGMKI